MNQLLRQSGMLVGLKSGGEVDRQAGRLAETVNVPPPKKRPLNEYKEAICATGVLLSLMVNIISNTHRDRLGC